MKPRLLDLFCGAGGCSRGYADAGFEVVGVDVEPQPNYPYEFHCWDALGALQSLLDGERLGLMRYRLDDFDAIHASPPCQAFSLASLHHGKEGQAKHPDLVEPTRRLLKETGLPFVIENVMGAPVRPDVTLCGEMFGLRLHRHRIFECEGFFCLRISHQPHKLKGARDNCHVEEGYTRQVAGNYADHDSACEAMGIDWMTRDELRLGIPPAYTHFIGEQLMAHLEHPVEAAA